MSLKEEKRIRRHRRVRSRISGTPERPRVSVSKSNTNLFVQIIDDVKGHTLLSISTKKFEGNKSEQAFEAGKKLAEEAKKAGISKVVFDRGGNLYTGRVQKLAEGLREGGLEF